MLTVTNLPGFPGGVAVIFALSLFTAPGAARAVDEEAATEEIVVTGSRIKRSDYTSSAPLTVIPGQALLDAGLSNLGEALRNQPTIGASGFNQSSVLGGGGATSVDLRNLGTERVLILINGRRVASFADALANLSADLTFVPLAMVDRVEILRDGAAAVYGSDAISGVINVFLKDDFEGVELEVEGGASGDNDGETYLVSATFGAGNDRGNLVFGAEVRDQKPVRQVDRDWAFPVISSLTETGFQHGSFFSPGGVFLDFNGSVFCTNPERLGGDEITNVFPNCPSARIPTSRDEVVRYDYGLEQDLIAGSRVTSASAYGTYDLAETLRVFLETQYARRETDSHLDGNAGSFGTPALPAGSIVAASNPNLPAGSAGGFFYFRPTSTIGPRTSRYESDTLRIVAGIDGALPRDIWFSEDWTYELSFLYTEVDADLNTDSIWNLARFIRISDPNLCAADAECARVVNPSGALDAIRPGNWTQPEIEYLRQPAEARSRFRTRGWSGSVSGPVAELPAGTLEAVLGFEYREDYGFNRPDPVTEAGESVANQIFTSEGDYDVAEWFLELDLPLVADLPLVRDLSLNLQYRDSDYSTFGSEDVYRVGIAWQVTDDLRIRANNGTAYRTPTVIDLFGGGTSSFDFVDDPCVNPEPGSNTAANCALHGLGPGFIQITNQYSVQAGSNPELQPETADTRTIGFVYTPSWLEGFSMSFDVWDIEVENIISRNTSTSVLEDCYGGAIGLTDPSCDQFEGRRPGIGVPVNFINRLTNVGSATTDGFDLGADYTFSVADTEWRIGLLATYVDENTLYPEAGGADNLGSIPRVQANLTTDLDWRHWTITWLVRYISSLDDPRYDGNNPFGYSGPDSYETHDMRLAYNWDDGYRLLLGVNNLADRDPPYVFSSGNNTDSFLYDVRGRYWFLRFTANL